MICINSRPGLGAQCVGSALERILIVLRRGVRARWHLSLIVLDRVAQHSCAVINDMHMTGEAQDAIRGDGGYMYEKLFPRGSAPTVGGT
jgi:hypothetical protein